jgi:oxalate decarboxylase/phosphoglucose isomerase-like protein (cupin superfamily)
MKGYGTMLVQGKLGYTGKTIKMEFANTVYVPPLV